MRKSVLMAGALLALTATAAAADGTEIAWTACRGSVAPVAAITRTLACTATTTTSGSSVFPSFVVSGTTALLAANVIVDYQVADIAMPCWWDFGTSASPNLRFPALIIDDVAPGVDATDPDNVFEIGCGGSSGFYFNGKSGGAGGGINPDLSGNRRRIKAAAFLPGVTGADASGNGIQQHTVRIRITNQFTGGGCLGCLTPACLIVNEILLEQVLPAPDVSLVSPVSAGSNIISWQGGVGTDCPGATPTRNATWGSVKALYR